MMKTARTGGGRTRPLSATALALLAAVLLAACGGGGGGGATDGGGLTFEATEFEFASATATADAGEVSVTIDNQGEQRHTWTIEGRESDILLDANSGQNDSGTVDLEPGRYTFYCDVPGHREAGMEGTLTVEGS